MRSHAATKITECTWSPLVRGISATGGNARPVRMGHQFDKMRRGDFMAGGVVVKDLVMCAGVRRDYKREDRTVIRVEYAGVVPYC